MGLVRGICLWLALLGHSYLFKNAVPLVQPPVVEKQGQQHDKADNPEKGAGGSAVKEGDGHGVCLLV